MPELPEVETIVRGLRPWLEQKWVVSVHVLDERLLEGESLQRMQAFWEGSCIETVFRRGKYIGFRLNGARLALFHMRMTGKFIVSDHHACEQLLPDNPEGGETPKRHHIRFVLLLKDGTRVRLQDTRRFATCHLYEAGEPVYELEKLGPEPLDSTALNKEWLRERAAKRSIPIKPFLLDQGVIAGLGNIYACESLFQAGIDPRHPAAALGEDTLHTLILALQDVLRLALTYNGTTIRDFHAVDEKKGSFQDMLMVYGRAGDLCRRCRDGRIERIRQSGRATFFCPRCQK